MIAVSYLKSIYPKDKTIKLIDESSADLIHVDLMDGIYVEQNNLKIEEVLNDLKDTSKPLDIHLMVNEPLKYIQDLVSLKNIWAITFHLDATNNPLEIINYVKSQNIKVGIAINPNEDISILDNYYSLIDYVLVMSVTPGKGGQKFMVEVLPKLKKLKDKNVLIGIDGGINNETINYLKEYHIDNIISGSYICMSDDFEKQINILKEAMK